MAPSSKATLPDKRKTLAEQLGGDSLQENPSLVSDFMQALDETVRESYGFRNEAPSTQRRHERHLREYRMYIRLRNRLPATSSDEGTDLLGFPNEHRTLLHNFRGFVKSVFELATGIGGGKLKYGTLVQYRDSISIWARRKLSERQVEPPTWTTMFQATTEVMQHIYRQLGPRKREPKLTGIGLVELRELLEHEMNTASYPEFSEQHQLVWCVARQTAIRPGSIGFTKGREENYLRWEDIEIRNEGDGRFSCVFTFKHLKGRQAYQFSTPRSLQCYLQSPNDENLIFSVPHRLLVIALRRKLLVNISTIEELMSTDLVYIRIANEHLKDPVFLRELPGGRGIDYAQPPPAMAAVALTAFLSDRSRMLGYASGITMYSFRRRTATELVATIGADKTRGIMGHAPDTRTLERYYLNLAPMMDLTGATLHQPTGPGAIMPGAVANYAPYAEGRLPTAVMKQVTGTALHNLFDELMANDPDAPSAGDPKTDKLYLRRVRKYALRILADEAHKSRKETVTLGDLDTRGQELVDNAANFASAVRKRASGMMTDNTTMSDQELEAATGINLDRDFPDDGNDTTDAIAISQPEDDAEEDAEVAAETSDMDLVSFTATGEEFEATTDTSAESYPYRSLATAFMDLLMDHADNHPTLGPWKDRPDREKMCPLCQRDLTVPRKTADKIWANADHLDTHMTGGTFHSPYGRWRRIRIQEAEETQSQEPDVRHIYRCPYGGEAYVQLEHLVRHIQIIIAAKKPDPTHYDAILADGWLEPGWYGELSKSVVNTRATRHLRFLDSLGLQFQKKVYSAAVPDPIGEGAFRGSISFPWPEFFEGLSRRGSHPESFDYREYFDGQSDRAARWGSHPNKFDMTTIPAGRRYKRGGDKTPWLEASGAVPTSASSTAQAGKEMGAEEQGSGKSAQEAIEVGSGDDDGGDNVKDEAGVE